MRLTQAVDYERHNEGPKPDEGEKQLERGETHLFFRCLGVGKDLARRTTFRLEKCSRCVLTITTTTGTSRL